jgi:nitroreductase
MTEHTRGAAPDWTAVVAAAVRAPSIHNTQPWTFSASPDRLELRLDRERARATNRSAAGARWPRSCARRGAEVPGQR